MVLGLKKVEGITPPELQAHVDELFPHGVSAHGHRHFVSPKSDVTSRTPALELLFENVRASRFRNRPSRFQSFFGCETTQAVVDFAKRYRTPQGGAVWAVEPAAYFRADMKLLLLEGTVLARSALADRYWRGQAGPSGKPFWEVLLVPPVRVIRRVTDLGDSFVTKY